MNTAGKRLNAGTTGEACEGQGQEWVTFQSGYSLTRRLPCQALGYFEACVLPQGVFDNML